jgi:hypothetical protein
MMGDEDFKEMGESRSMRVPRPRIRIFPVPATGERRSESHSTCWPWLAAVSPGERAEREERARVEKILTRSLSTPEAPAHGGGHARKTVRIRASVIRPARVMLFIRDYY